MISQSDQTVAALQDLIERGSLEPGSMVSERTLMQLTGFGRTPVREAIQRLALSHMLRIHPNRGIEIPAASVEDQLSRLEVRRTTEVLAVTLACERAAREDLADMEVLTAALSGEFSLQSYLDTVRRTHDLIIRAARNPWLLSLALLLTPMRALRFAVACWAERRALALFSSTLPSCSCKSLPLVASSISSFCFG